MNKIFQLKANIEFIAKDLDDAFEKLQEHFKKLKNSKESNLIIKGEIELEVKSN